MEDENEPDGRKVPDVTVPLRVEPLDSLEGKFTGDKGTGVDEVFGNVSVEDSSRLALPVVLTRAWGDGVRFVDSMLPGAVTEDEEITGRFDAWLLSINDTVTVVSVVPLELLPALTLDGDGRKLPNSWLSGLGILDKVERLDRGVVRWDISV